MLALDGSVSPYLPTKQILAAIEQSVDRELDSVTLVRMLRERLALLHGIDPQRIALFPHDRHRFATVAAFTGHLSWTTYSPGVSSLGIDGVAADVVEIERNERFRIEADQIGATPPDSVALVMTPNDPTGNALSVTTAAQLGRRCRLLVLDERSAEMQRRSMIPLVEEFETIVLFRSFSDWAGLGRHAPGYAIASKRIAAAIDRPDELDACGLQAALAAVSNAAELDAIAYRIRLERLRLFRMLRKLNFLMPLPSDAGYVLARVMRGDRETVEAALAERDISVFAPPQPQLLDTLRFTAISPAATRKLQAALVEVSRLVD